MVVRSTRPEPAALDLGYLGFFLGLRVNELVMDRMAAAGFENVRESHGFVIQHLIDADRTITELAERMAVTQQAASKVVAELVDLGVLVASPGEDRRAKRIRLSRRGWEAVRLGRRARRQIEARLAKAVGARGYAAARATIARCLDTLGGVERIRARRIRSPR
jgi:DNA-binding MarR family transcriptional regulator